MSQFRFGNIVYYEDIPDCGYPIFFNKKFWTNEKLRSISFETPIKNDGIRDIFIKPMLFRFDEFWEENCQLKCKDSDLPKEIIHLHEFQNWYEDKYGKQPKIYRGGHLLNKPFFE